MHSVYPYWSKLSSPFYPYWSLLYGMLEMMFVPLLETIHMTKRIIPLTDYITAREAAHILTLSRLDTFGNCGMCRPIDSTLPQNSTYVQTFKQQPFDNEKLSEYLSGCITSAASAQPVAAHPNSHG
jgi:hypothetical protein